MNKKSASVICQAGRIAYAKSKRSVLHGVLRLRMVSRIRAQTIMNKIKERSRRKLALADRKSAASQARMKSIANLAADDRVPKKRRKTGGGECSASDDASM